MRSSCKLLREGMMERGGGSIYIFFQCIFFSCVFIFFSSVYTCLFFCMLIDLRISCLFLCLCKYISEYFSLACFSVDSLCIHALLFTCLSVCLCLYLILFVCLSVYTHACQLVCSLIFLIHKYGSIFLCLSIDLFSLS